MPIEIERLSHAYDAQEKISYPAVNDVSLTIEEGEFLGVIGHTGSGKSTLLQHMNGLLLPTAGSVRIDGMDTQNAKLRREIRARVGMVFQYPEYQLFEETVAADVAFGPKNMGLNEDEVRARVSEALSRVGLDEARFAEQSPFDLSGGEKRRAALAGILAMRPKYLILDEPMAGLDPRGRNEILTLIERLRRESGTTIIMVSHSMDDVAKFASRIAVLNDGRLFLLDTPENVFAHGDELTSMGLDLPQATRLVRRLNEGGMNVPSFFRMDELTKYLVGRWQA